MHFNLHTCCLQCSGSQPGVILLPRGQLTISEDIFLQPVRVRGGWYWFLMGRDKGYLKTPFSEQNSFPQQKIIHSRMSIDLKLRNPTVAIANRKSRSSDRLYFGGSKIIVDGACSHEKTLAPWKESYEKSRQHIKKQRHHFFNKGLYSQSYGFPIVMYRCERGTIKKAECPRIDAFKLWCWRRFLRVPWTGGGSNQSTLKEINPNYSLEGLILKLQYSGHLMRRANSLEKTPVLARIDGKGKEGSRWWDG